GTLVLGSGWSCGTLVVGSEVRARPPASDSVASSCGTEVFGSSLSFGVVMRAACQSAGSIAIPPLPCELSSLQAPTLITQFQDGLAQIPGGIAAAERLPRRNHLYRRELGPDPDRDPGFPVLRNPDLGGAARG